MSTELEHFPITHAHLTPTVHPRLKADVMGRSAVRYLRFLRPVKIDRLELPCHVYSRYVPTVPVHPAHMRISILDRDSMTWKQVREAEFERNPGISGDNLSQEMSTEEMDEHFKKVVEGAKPWVVELGGLETDHLRVECDREHPVWPNHGESYGTTIDVPFGMLHPLKAWGEQLVSSFPDPKYMPIMRQTTVRPKAPRGMKVKRVGEMILFEGKQLSVGFALRRPILMHLGWDAFKLGRAGANKVSQRRVWFRDLCQGIGGPLLVDLQGDCSSYQWTGEVDIQDNRVAYRNVHCARGVRIDAVFHVEPDRLVLELEQQADADLPVLEYETWRFAWSLHDGMTGVAAVPTLRPGRSGDVHLPAMFASDGVGCLSCRILDGDADQVRLEVESYRECTMEHLDKRVAEATAGIVLGPRPGPDGCNVVPARRISATLEMAVCNLQPAIGDRKVKAGKGILQHWASNFSCYRPEWAGFSDHAASVNCHMSQDGPVDVACFTAKPEFGPDPAEMARFTIGRAIMGGTGYGYWRNLFMDTDPVLMSAAGRLHQVKPDLAWLKLIHAGLTETTDRLLGTIADEGLAVCHDLSGNSGTYRWSTNCWDVVGFGHMDAYVNVWTYRALRTATALMGELDDRSRADRCREAADVLRANFAAHLVNPETGWVVGWKSRDGELHDYGYIWINGPACAFGLLEPPAAKKALKNLEKECDKLGLGSVRLGLPYNLLPLREEDHMLGRVWGVHTEPTFEFYTDGAIGPGATAYYLRALSTHGFKARARRIAKEMDESFAQDLFTCGAGRGIGTGREFFSWEGLPNGYEGTMANAFAVLLYAIAIEQKLIDPPEPEWWPVY